MKKAPKGIIIGEGSRNSWDWFAGFIVGVAVVVAIVLWGRGLL